ncbi:MAG TPA: glycosyltransferase family 39 protein [Candidatus Limnocylindrales bacterium]|nr:glycosyltransferase family 39 protein [Candidatus Limnocylindrales bacterium]
MTAGTVLQRHVPHVDLGAIAERRKWLPPLVAASIAAVLGLYRIGDKSLSVDEAYEYAIAQFPTSLFLETLPGNLERTVYLFILRPWLMVGDGEVHLRLLSVVFGVIAVLATYAVGKRYAVAFPAALLLAVAPQFVQYEQDARHYTLFVAWSALTTLAYLRLTERPGRREAVIYVVLAGLMIYVHLLGSLVIVAHGLATLFLVDRPLRPRILALYVPVGLAWLPVIPFVFAQRGRFDWVPPLTALSLSEHLILLTGGPLLAGAMAVLLAGFMRKDLPALWLAVPIVGTVLISLIFQPLMQARYVLGVLPAAALIVGRARTAMLAVVVALSLIGVFNWYETGYKTDWRTGAAFVSARVQPGDGIVFASPWIRLPFAYYAQVADPIYPSHPWSTPFLSSPGQRLPVAGHDRIWLVLGHGTEAPDWLWQELEPYRLVESLDLGDNLDIQLLEAPQT